MQKNEIIIAIIGVIGTLGAAILSNLDKILPGRKVVQATYAGYEPTGDFETELRYYFEVSGARKMLQKMSEDLLASFEAQLKAEYADDPEEVRKTIKTARDETLTVDKLIDLILPIYKKYFTVTEVQELNKFYSTRPMREMIDKMPQVLNDFIPVMIRLTTRNQDRSEDRGQALLK
jgi:Uncharacterized protein conserved in bacteria (DUF2059)